MPERQCHCFFIFWMDDPRSGGKTPSREDDRELFGELASFYDCFVEDASSKKLSA